MFGFIELSKVPIGYMVKGLKAIGDPDDHYSTFQPLFDKWKRTGIILDLYDHLRGTAKCDPDGDPSDLSDSWHIGHDPDDNAKRIDGRFGKGFGTNE